MQTTNIQTQAFRPLNPAELLGGNTHYRIGSDQIIFYFEPWATFVITTITDAHNYTQHDYFLLPEGAPYQLINGKLIYMASPFDIHQAILGNIYLEIGSFVKKAKSGIVRVAPLDVVLDDQNVFQPDILFVAIKRNSIIKRKIFGAPDFVVEILSSNSQHDRHEKFQAYQKHGVVEYWIVHPTQKYVEVYHNQDNLLKLVQTAQDTGTIISKAIEGFQIEVEDIFEYDLDEMRGA